MKEGGVESQYFPKPADCESQIHDESADVIVRPINGISTFKGGMLSSKSRFKLSSSFVDSSDPIDSEQLQINKSRASANQIMNQEVES